jgi:hypothetical protein
MAVDTREPIELLDSSRAMALGANAGADVIHRARSLETRDLMISGPRTAVYRTKVLPLPLAEVLQLSLLWRWSHTKSPRGEGERGALWVNRRAILTRFGVKSASKIDHAILFTALLVNANSKLTHSGNNRQSKSDPPVGTMWHHADAVFFAV